MLRGDIWKGSTLYWYYLEDYWPCAGGLSAVNAIGMHMREPDKVVAESGRSPGSKHHIQSECGEWEGWRGTGRPNLSGETEFSGANWDEEIFISPVQLTTSRLGNLARLIHTYILYGQLLIDCIYVCMYVCMFGSSCPEKDKVHVYTQMRCSYKHY